MPSTGSYLTRYLDGTMRKRRDLCPDDRNAKTFKKSSFQPKQLLVKLRPNVSSKSLMPVSIPPRLIVKPRRKAKKQAMLVTRLATSPPQMHSSSKGGALLKNLRNGNGMKENCLRDCVKGYTQKTTFTNNAKSEPRKEACTNEDGMVNRQFSILHGCQRQHTLNDVARIWSDRSRNQIRTTYKSSTPNGDPSMIGTSEGKGYEHLKRNARLQGQLNQSQVYKESASDSIHKSLEDTKCPGDSNEGNYGDNRKESQNTCLLSALEHTVDGNSKNCASEMVCQTVKEGKMERPDVFNSNVAERKDCEQQLLIGEFENTGCCTYKDALLHKGEETKYNDTFKNKKDTSDYEHKEEDPILDIDAGSIRSSCKIEKDSQTVCCQAQTVQQEMDGSTQNSITIQGAMGERHVDVEDDVSHGHQEMSGIKKETVASSREKVRSNSRNRDDANALGHQNYVSSIHKGSQQAEAVNTGHESQGDDSVVGDLARNFIEVLAAKNGDRDKRENYLRSEAKRSDLNASGANKPAEVEENCTNLELRARNDTTKENKSSPLISASRPRSSVKRLVKTFPNKAASDSVHISKTDNTHENSPQKLKKPVSAVKKEETFEKQREVNEAMPLKADPVTEMIKDKKSHYGKTPNCLQNTLHGNEAKTKFTITNQANIHASATSDLHCNTARSVSNTNNESNPVTTRSPQITFEGSYSCRLLRKERNVGSKVHRELKRREKETGGLKVLSITSKSDENHRPFSRESTVSRISSKIRSRRNSVVEFFHRRLSIDKIAARTQSTTKVTKLTNETQEHPDKVFQALDQAVTPLRNDSPCQIKENIALSIPRSNTKTPVSSVLEEVDDHSLGIPGCNSMVGVTKVQISGMAHDNASEYHEDPTNAEGATYDILQYSNVKKKIDELKRLKKSKRKTQALGTYTVDICADYMDDADISAEKTYKKAVPAIRKFGKALQKTMNKIEDTNPECKGIQPSGHRLDKYTSSECIFQTVDTHSSRLSMGTTSGKQSRSSHQKPPQSPASTFSITRGTTPLYPSIMNELDCRSKVVWRDEVGNLCEVESREGKYGEISCKSGGSFSAKQVNHISRNSEYHPEVMKISKINGKGNEGPLSPEAIRKKKEALAQVWTGLPHTSHSPHTHKHEQYTKPPEHCIIYSDGLSINMRIQQSKRKPGKQA